MMRNASKALLLLAILVAFIAFYARYIEPYHLTTRQLTVNHQNAPFGYEEITIAVFSDTHFGPYYTLENFENVKSVINSKNPDIILFCGDLIDNYNEYDGDTIAISSALAKLNAKIGKYAIFGNHDHGGGAFRAYNDIMKAGGFTVFINDFIEFPELNLTLTGLDDFIFGKASTDTAALAPENSYNILFCHEPDIADLILPYNIDFMTAGHTHGGQISLPGYKHVFFPAYGQKYLKGSYSFENDRQTLLYVNSGIGMTKLPFRFMARAEVTFITITNPEAPFQKQSR